MKTIITAWTILALAAAGAHARGRVFSGGRAAARSTGRVTFRAAATRPAAPRASAPHFSAPSSSLGGAGSRGVSSGGVAAFTTRNGRASGSGFAGGMSGFTAARSRTSASSSNRFWFGRSFGSSLRRTSADSGGGGDVPPNYTKPGALIRSEGQLPVYSDPGNARTHSVDGGGFIAQDPSKARDSNRSPGVTWGPADTHGGAPSSGAGGNGVTANGPALSVTDNSHSNNINGNQNAGGGNENGNHGNNGNHYGGSSFDPSF